MPGRKSSRNRRRNTRQQIPESSEANDRRQKVELLRTRIRRDEYELRAIQIAAAMIADGVGIELRAA